MYVNWYKNVLPSPFIRSSTTIIVHNMRRANPYNQNNHAKVSNNQFMPLIGGESVINFNSVRIK